MSKPAKDTFFFLVSNCKPASNLEILAPSLSRFLFCLNNREGTVFKNSLESLVKEIINSLESVPVDDIKLNPSEKPKAPVANAPKIEIKKKPGRAFQHKLTGKNMRRD